MSMQLTSDTRLDITGLKAENARLAAAIVALKKEIRGTPLPWDRNLYRDLRLLKAQATLCCAIRAHHRGRLHLRKCTRAHAYLGLPQLEQMGMAEQAKFIGDRWREYLREEIEDEIAV